jgi:DNA-binding response OmpR family regulator
MRVGDGGEMAGQRVLLVHDNADCRRIYGAALAHEGYDITVTDDGDEAFEQYSHASSPWALVVSDLFVRSRVDECFLRLLRRARTKSPRPPVLVLSAWSTDDHRRLANEEGADAYFPLPVAPTDFLIVVHDLLAPKLPPRVTLRSIDRADRTNQPLKQSSNQSSSTPP